MQGSYNRHKQAPGDNPGGLQPKTRNIIIAFVIIASLGTVITIVALIPALQASNVPRIEMIDETETVTPWSAWTEAIVQPPDLKCYTILVPGVVYGNFAFYKMTSDNAVASVLGITASSLYLSNGTAKMFWGISANGFWTTIFKDAGEWRIGGFFQFNNDDALLATKYLASIISS